LCRRRPKDEILAMFDEVCRIVLRCKQSVSSLNLNHLGADARGLETDRARKGQR